MAECYSDEVRGPNPHSFKVSSTSWPVFGPVCRHADGIDCYFIPVFADHGDSFWSTVVYVFVVE